MSLLDDLNAQVEIISGWVDRVNKRLGTVEEEVAVLGAAQNRLRNDLDREVDVRRRIEALESAKDHTDDEA